MNQDEKLFMRDYTNHKNMVVEAFYVIADQLYRVTNNINIHKMLERINSHDDSKLTNTIEKEGYININRELTPIPYGTEEFFEIKKKYDFVIQEHYKNNRHHVEHFKRGILDMDKYDIIEMFCDWIGAMFTRTNRLTESKINNFIEFNINKYGIKYNAEVLGMILLMKNIFLDKTRNFKHGTFIVLKG